MGVPDVEDFCPLGVPDVEDVGVPDVEWITFNYPLKWGYQKFPLTHFLAKPKKAES